GAGGEVLRALAAPLAAGAVGPRQHDVRDHTPDWHGLARLPHRTPSRPSTLDQIRSRPSALPTSGGWRAGEVPAFLAPRAAGLRPARVRTPASAWNRARPEGRDTGVSVVHHDRAPQGWQTC